MDEAREMTPEEREEMERQTLEAHAEFERILALRAQLKRGVEMAREVAEKRGYKLHPRLAQAGVTRMGGDAEGGSGERSELARDPEGDAP